MFCASPACRFAGINLFGNGVRRYRPGRLGFARTVAGSNTSAGPSDMSPVRISAVGTLDTAGFLGPYALALTPQSYNHLFRLYPQSDTTELEHARQVVTDRIIKAPALPGGGVLIDTSGPFANIVLGQDLMTSFVGPAPGRYQFAILESVALWVRVPEAICILK